MENQKHTTDKCVARNLHIINKRTNQPIGQAFLVNLNHDKTGKSIPCKEGESNAVLWAASNLMLKDLVDTLWLVEQGATHEELIERIKCFKNTITNATK